MAILPKVIHIFNVIPIKLLLTFFTELEKNYFKFHMEPKNEPHSQDNPKQKEQSWKNHVTWLQTILQGYSNQNSMFWLYTTNILQGCRYQNRYVEQWNRKEASEIMPYIYNNLIFDKPDKNKQWEKDFIFNKWCWKNWLAILQKTEMGHFPYTL